MEQNRSYGSYEYGKFLANPLPGEEVVISGIAGKFPRSNNVSELAKGLFNSEDLIDDDFTRWDIKLPDLPKRNGKIPNIQKFDAGFFGLSYNASKSSDPVRRKALEATIEAILDAGINPSDMEGTKTGIFCGNSMVESGCYWFFTNKEKNTDIIPGLSVSLVGHTIAHYLKLNGPSFTVDAACSSSISALENAYQAIRNGQIEYAIVLGLNLNLLPYVALSFLKLGVLDPNGQARPFDIDGKGFLRGESLSAILLQKSKDANRVYATIVHTKSNNDGYKDSGITYPSEEMQTQLLKEVYLECDIDPRKVGFVEAHGTGTKAGDIAEIMTIDNVFMKGRDEPMYIGSVKGNVGHSEPASGLNSLMKAIFTFETGYIPPNINYKTPKKNATALEEGRLKVLMKTKKFDEGSDLIAINNFGFGGSNGHILLKQNQKKKIDGGKSQDDILRLVCVSGRTEEAVQLLLDSITNSKDVEHMRLVQNIFRKNIKGHDYRGFTVLNRHREVTRSIKSITKCERPIYVVFGELHNTEALFEQLLQLPLFLNTMDRIQEVYAKTIFDIKSMITQNGTDTANSRSLANVFRQIGIIELLKAVKFHPSGFFGSHSAPVLGDLICAYYDGTLTLQETVQFADALLTTVTDKVPINGTTLLEIEKQKTGKILQNICDKLKNATERHLLTNGNLIKSLEISEPFRIIDQIPPKSIILQIGNVNKDVSKALLEKNFDTKLTVSSGMSEFLASIGSLYQAGQNLHVYKLFPNVAFPVSRGTPMISPSISWLHQRDWFVARYNVLGTVSQKYTIALDDTDWAFIDGHVIDGRTLFPATGYLVLAWMTIARLRGYDQDNMEVVLENCMFKRACNFTKRGVKLKFCVTIQTKTGNFEVIEGESPVVTGRIYIPEESHEAIDSGVESEMDSSNNCIKLTTKDIYKELRLRGYHYSGSFRGIQDYNLETNTARLKWNNNWIAFMDNMLQTQIIPRDTRLLYIPTSISRVHINSKKHVEIAKQSEDSILPIYVKKYGQIISGGIEIRGLMASSIARKKYNAVPVLEEYTFVPNVATLSLEQSLRVNMQFLLENAYGITVKAVELIDSDADEFSKPLSALIREILLDIPLIKPNIMILSDREIIVDDIPVNKKNLSSETDCAVIVGTNLLQRKSVLKTAWKCLKPNGFILTRECCNVDLSSIDRNITILTEHMVENEKLVLLRKSTARETHTVINVSSTDDSFSWLPKLQAEIKKGDKTIVCAQNDPINGIMGLVNCIRAEEGGAKVKSFFILEADAPTFDTSHPFYVEQIDKNMSINVFKDGVWGTYKHLLLETNNEKVVEHTYINTMTRGDLSTTRFVEGPLTSDTNTDPDVLLHVYYSAVNFRDVMFATGKINMDIVIKDRRQQECVQGCEFSGRTKDGRRVMACAPNGCQSTLVAVNKHLMWEIPDDWSLADGATIPVVYGTCVYSFFTRTELKPGESLLIHSGAGGLGQAAIQMALSMGCTVYTTVGSKEKREYLLKTFPQLTDRNIANSRDLSFEAQVMKETKGRGVDVVVNSLAEDKLLATARCLARGGRFLEVGKHDLGVNNPLGLLLFEKEASFHGIVADVFLNAKGDDGILFHDLIQDAIDKGLIKPLPKRVFKSKETEEAYRYMATGNHMGKILIEVREEEVDKLFQPTPKFQTGLERYHCDNTQVYIICGGLGGFGLELADWLVIRRCRKLILTSRTGISSAYQQQRIQIWQSYGCDVRVSTQNISSKLGVEALIDEAKELGPVAAVFNLAVVLQDALLENQTEESFQTSFKPKALATQYLDEVTRQRCPKLKDFVVFSSVSCGRGNMGQSNYGMANSVMERICERRKNDGLPALAIQWGAVGDVGLVADMQEKHIELEISGTLQQRVSNCLEVMNGLLTQKKATIVSSMVVAEKKIGSAAGGDVVAAVANIIGINDLKSVSFHSTLAEIGMDSMSAVEVKQTLERDFDLFLTAQDLKKLTFARLQELQAEKAGDNPLEDKVDASLVRMELTLKLLGDEALDNVPFLQLKSKGTEKSPKVFLFPGLEGSIAALTDMVLNMEAEVIGLQYCYDNPISSIEGLAEAVLPIIEEKISKEAPFNFVAYSFGSLVALEVLKKLEEKGCDQGNLLIIDGAPNYFKTTFAQMFPHNDEDEFQTRFLCYVMTMDVPAEEVLKHKGAIYKCKNLEERMELAHSVVGSERLTRSLECFKLFGQSAYLRIKAALSYAAEYKINSKVTLFKPTAVSVHMDSEDYDLSSICSNLVEVKVFEGNHSSILSNFDLVENINAALR